MGRGRSLNLGALLFWVGLALSLAASLPCLGQVTTSTNPIFGQKDTFGIGPRAIGMGSAFTALADDASAVYWNPAGLSQMSSYDLELSSSPLNFDSHFGFPYYSSFQFIIPIAKENTLGISMFRPINIQHNFYAGSTLDSATAEEASYILNPTFQMSEILLSYAARFATLQNFSVGVNIKRITNDPYYIKYFPNTNDTFNTQNEQNLKNAIRVIGYGVDIGFLYRVPITKYSEEFRLGLDLRDLVSKVNYINQLGVTVSSAAGNPVSIDQGNGFETSVPPEITLGLALTNHYLFRVRNVIAFDYDQIADQRFSSAENTYLRFGTEFWFFNDVLGVRGGYETPISRPGDISLGLSFRTLGGDLQADLAYLFPISPPAQVANGSAIATSSEVLFEPFYIGLNFAFGGGQEIPPPKVGAFVRPAQFTPSAGEKATFFLDTSEDVTVRKWSVLIYDSSNHYVRGMRGVGAPPTQLVWGGEDDSYQPLPPGVYTWAFQVQDELGHIGSTPIQTVEILGPVQALTRDPAKLLAIRQQQANLLSQERQMLSQLAQKNLQDLLGEPTPTTATAAAAPVEPTPNTMTPEAGTVPFIGFNNLPPDHILNAHFEKNAQGDTVVAVSYQSKLDYVPYIYEEASDVIKATVNSVGTGLKDIQTRVYYGKNELSIRTPTQAAANYATGRINQTQLMQLSDIDINGQKVGPNGY
ncbi:MAG TPA: PorV/PorQ family protein [bacterium]|nr:PorV/PorQ family protein [bacterium]